MTRPAILPGDIVVHEYDRPHGNCLRLVTVVYRTYVGTHYLTGGHNPGLGGRLFADHDMVARLVDFGKIVRPDPIEDRIEVVDAGPVIPPTATYRDGARRHWQGATQETVLVRPHVMRMWRRLKSEET